MIMKTQPLKIYAMLQKQCSEGNSQQYSNKLLKKGEKSQFENLIHHLNELEKKEQTKPKVSRRKESLKSKEEINKLEIKTTIEKNQ